MQEMSIEKYYTMYSRKYNSLCENAFFIEEMRRSTFCDRTTFP